MMIVFKNYKVIMLAFSYLFLSSQTFAEEQDAASQLSTLLGELVSFEAKFKQYVVDENQQLADETEGSFSLLRPNRFRWLVSLPYEQEIIADGENLWTYDKDLEQITVQKLDTGLDATPALLLSSGKEELVSSFNIKRLPSSSEIDVYFELTPKDKASLFESLNLLFINGQLIELKLQDSLGQKTYVQFKSAKLNPEIAISYFDFSPPEGVDLIDSREQL